MGFLGWQFSGLGAFFGAFGPGKFWRISPGALNFGGMMESIVHSIGHPAALGPPTKAAGFLTAVKKALTWVWTSGIKRLPIDLKKESRQCLISSLATPLKILQKFFAGGRSSFTSIGPAKTAQDSILDPESRESTPGFLVPGAHTSPQTPNSSPIIKVTSTSRRIAKSYCARESTYYTRLWTAWVRGPKEFWKHSPEKRKKSNTTKRRLEGGKMEASTEIDVVCPWCGGWVQVISDPNGGPLVRAAHLLKSPKEGKKVQLCFGSSTRVEGY
jgi:hypothetical protein